MVHGKRLSYTIDAMTLAVHDPAHVEAFVWAVQQTFPNIDIADARYMVANASWVMSPNEFTELMNTAVAHAIAHREQDTITMQSKCILFLANAL